MKTRRFGLTLVEILVVVGIIALLTGMLIPAVSMVQKTAKEVKQKAQFSTMDLALTSFKNDYGDYPPSNYSEINGVANSGYCGAHKLTEALLGWDLLGFNPKSDFRADGCTNNNVFIYDVNNIDFLDRRKGPYLDTDLIKTFRTGQLFADADPLAYNAYLLCDVFTMKKVSMPDGHMVSAGAPILYYRANPTKRLIREIYNYADNDAIVQVKELADNRGEGIHPLGRPDNQYEYFYDYIRDPKRETVVWPYKSDSYILISAGADGLYGTADDIRNFGN